MSFYTDDKGQGASEYLLLFGGLIVIAIAALVIYRAYFAQNSALNASTDINAVRHNMSPPPANNSTPNPPSP